MSYQKVSDWCCFEYGLHIRIMVDSISDITIHYLYCQLIYIRCILSSFTVAVYLWYSSCSIQNVADVIIKGQFECCLGNANSRVCNNQKNTYNWQKTWYNKTLYEIQLQTRSRRTDSTVLVPKLIGNIRKFFLRTVYQRGDVIRLAGRRKFRVPAAVRRRALCSFRKHRKTYDAFGAQPNRHHTTQ